ncbi:hypothetical protein [Burkholderia ubonensis]|uniref:hypothetical protein n=1 Tax=Burkholderia ubonensis TaxID=101571 RepID=UPI000A625710|nr:hypothetical protein [Burkholderia ubonensis]
MSDTSRVVTLTDEQILEIGYKHFKPGHNVKAESNFVAAVRDVLAASPVDQLAAAPTEQHHLHGIARVELELVEREARALAPTAPAPADERAAFYLCTPKDSGEGYVIDRAPDSFELRDCEIIALQADEKSAFALVRKAILAANRGRDIDTCSLIAADHILSVFGARAASANATVPKWVFDDLVNTLQPAWDYIQTHQEQFNAQAGDDKNAILVEFFLRTASANETGAERAETALLRRARQELSIVEWENDPPSRVAKLFDEIDALLAAHLGQSVPFDMLLFCPRCGTQHVDAPEEPHMVDRLDESKGMREWSNPPHRSNLCHACGIIWRPADVATVGVAAIETRGKADTWSVDMPWIGHNRPVATSANETGAEGASVINIDRREFFDFVRGAIRAALTDASEQPLEGAANAWADAHMRTEALFDRLSISLPAMAAAAPADERAAFDVALAALNDYQGKWDTGTPMPYAQSERIAMECACEAVRDALEEARAAASPAADAVAIPAGWKLMPIDAPESLLDVLCDAARGWPTYAELRPIYDKLLAAAQQPAQVATKASHEIVAEQQRTHEFVQFADRTRYVASIDRNAGVVPYPHHPAQADAPATIPDECAASGASCSYAPEGRHVEMQCRYCGKAQADAPAEAREPSLTNEQIAATARQHATSFVDGDDAITDLFFEGDSYLEFARDLLNGADHA